MIEQFAIDPVLVLQNFWQKCGWSGYSLESLEGGFKLNPDLLLQDLRQLNLAEFDRNHLAQIPQVIVLHGEKDRIVAVERGQVLQGQYFEIESAGHALPLTHREMCWKWLQPFFASDVEMVG